MNPRAWALAAALALSACDGGADRKKVQEALERYDALVAERRHPRDPAFAPVIAALEAAKPGTPEGDRARAMAEGLKRARVLPSPPRPLAVGPHGDEESPEIQARRAACAALARKLGEAPEAEKPALKGRLVACRTELERLDAEALHHGPGH
ncbi:MAG: hypothetical protein RL653_4087 [Pseudomonadota bacterium]